jgi:hypothetical protein
VSSLLIAVLLLLIVAVSAQVILPRLGERHVERRLTEGGGEAFVAIDAMPAWQLLSRTGDVIMVRGRSLVIGMSREGGGLQTLDRFRRVDVALDDFTTGPFAVAHFELTRDGPGPYLMRSQAHTTGAALAQFGGEQLGTGLIGTLAGVTPLTARQIPVEIEVELESVEGRVAVVGGGGRVAGYPAGPIATVIAAAVARRLEITI